MPLAVLDTVKEMQNVPTFFRAQCRLMSHKKSYFFSAGCPRVWEMPLRFCFLRFMPGEAIVSGDETLDSYRRIDLRLAVSDRFVRLAGF